MPQLHYSNRLDRLVVPLAENLRERDPFDEALIVVPNFSLQRWISLQLAQRDGIAANLRFVPLEKAFLQAIRTANPHLRHFILLTPVMLQRLLLDVITQKLDDPDNLWDPVRDYVQSDSPQPPEMKEKLIFQLSGRITRLFRDYEFSRNREILECWRKGELTLGDPSHELERWQRELWLGIFGREGILNKTRPDPGMRSDSRISHLKTLTEIYDLLNPDDLENRHEPVSGSNNSLHIFGVSYLSHFHQQALSRKLSRLFQIHVYTLNPCMEFWEDLRSSWEVKQEIRGQLEGYRKHFENDILISRNDFYAGELIRNEEDNPFLQAWGRPGRENIRLLNFWSGWEFHERFRDPLEPGDHGRSLLRQVQHDILVREPRRPSSLNLKQDDSLKVFACANPRREAEAIAGMIWELIHSDASLMLNEIAVIVYDMERYQHELEHVFQNLHDLPYNLIDGVRGSSSRLQQAAAGLLNLCFTEYNRRDMFALFENPCFLPRFRDPPGVSGDSPGEVLSPRQWLRWADDLEILFGIDERDHKNRGYSHLPKHLYHWEQGFQKLTLSAFYYPETRRPSLPSSLPVPEGKQLTPRKMSDEWDEEAARFVMIARSLIADTSEMGCWRMTGAQWGQYLQTLLKTYLGPQYETEENEFQKLCENALMLQELDLHHSVDKREISYSHVLQFYLQGLESVRVRKGHYLARGVTVSSFLPMRPIPFKVVFLPGMGEGLFPAPHRRDNLDLRHMPVTLSPSIGGRKTRERLIGDVSETERDRYMFLETLVSTRQSLVLSYVSRDEKTDDELNMSSVAQTLISELNRGYLETPFQIVRHPLKAYSCEYFPELSTESPILPTKKGRGEGGPCNSDEPSGEPVNPLKSWDWNAFEQARALRLREHLGDAFKNRDRIHGNMISHPEIREMLGLQKTDADRAKPEMERTALTLNQMRAFLESPLQSTARLQLGLREEEEEDQSREIHEPQEVERLLEWRVMRSALCRALTSGVSPPDWEKHYRDATETLVTTGTFPPGDFGKAVLNKHSQALAGWQFWLSNALSGIPWDTIQDSARKYIFGPLHENELFKSCSTPGHEFQPGSQFLLKPPLQLEHAEKPHARRIMLNGESVWWFVLKNREWYAVYFSLNPVKPKHWLRLFLNGVMLCASGNLPGDASVILSCVTTKNSESKTFEVPSPGICLHYLHRLASEMNDPRSAVWFPVEAVFAMEKEHLGEDDLPGRLEEWLEEESNKPFAHLSSQYGPVRFPADAPRPSKPHLIMQERFGLFFHTIGNPG